MIHIQISIDNKEKILNHCLEFQKKYLKEEDWELEAFYYQIMERIYFAKPFDKQQQSQTKE